MQILHGSEILVTVDADSDPDVSHEQVPVTSLVIEAKHDVDNGGDDVLTGTEEILGDGEDDETEAIILFINLKNRNR